MATRNIEKSLYVCSSWLMIFDNSNLCYNNLKYSLATLGWLSFSNTYIIRICLFFQVLKILVQTNEDRLFVVFNNGLSLLYEAFNMLQMMFHEATACHVTTEVRFFLQLSNLFFSKISKKMSLVWINDQIRFV